MNPEMTPSDPSIRGLNYKDFKAGLSKEQRARIEATEAAENETQPLREAQRNRQLKRNKAAEAVKIQDRRLAEAAKADRNLICEQIAEALNSRTPQNAEFALGKYIKDEFAFQKPETIKDLQIALNRLSNKDEDAVILKPSETPDFRLSTVYLKVEMANGKIEPVVIRVLADSTYTPESPTVTFEIIDMPQKPASQKPIEAQPLNKKPIAASVPKTMRERLSEIGGTVKNFFQSKK